MTTGPSDASTFPRQQARTRRFSLGRPRDIRVAADGSRITFLRSRAGDDPVNCLWAIDVEPFTERLVVDPRDLSVVDGNELPPEERARRERARESGGGIVAYGADRLLTMAAFTLGGELFKVGLDPGARAEAIPTPGPAVDPRPDPTGARVAYVCGGRLHLVQSDGRDEVVAGEPRSPEVWTSSPLSAGETSKPPPAPAGEGSGAGQDDDGADPDVTWGLAEFVAAEEMGRGQGYWWSPTGDALAVARVDIGPVARWRLSDPTDPAAEPTVVAYPAAGTANADVSLHIVSAAGAGDAPVEVVWDRAAFPYLARVTWQPDCPLTLLVQSRDQRTARILTVDTTTGATKVRAEDHDDAWLDLVPGVPTWTPSGELVTAASVDDTMRVLVDGRPASPEGVHVRAVIHAGETIVFAGSEDPTEMHIWDGANQTTHGAGLHGVVLGGDVMVATSADLDHFGARVTVHQHVLASGNGQDHPDTDARTGGQGFLGAIESFAEIPVVVPIVSLVRAGDRGIHTAALFPSGADDMSLLPVLLDPYGGPGHQRVVRSRNAYLESQWLADQGFAVVIADGRGTGGRGRAWDRAIHFDFATAALDDQVDALHAAAESYPRLDLSRVAIRGWSFGGYLAALAVLRRPDVFHAAVAGAPVTDWRLYDTHYTERYLGHPDDEPEAYRRSSLMDDAAGLSRPLLLIHGLGDDNVVVAHTLRLSRALFEAGRDHSVLPLGGITHMTPQEVVAENLLLLQVRFLRRALGIDQ